MHVRCYTGSCSSFPCHVWGARKLPEKGTTALVASFPGYVGGARKWPENEATAVKLVNL